MDKENPATLLYFGLEHYKQGHKWSGGCKQNEVLIIKEPLSWIFENDCSYGVEYSSKGMKTSCKDLYLKVLSI